MNDAFVRCQSFDRFKMNPFSPLLINNWALLYHVNKTISQTYIHNYYIKTGFYWGVVKSCKYNND